MKALAALVYIPFGSYRRTIVYLQKVSWPTASMLCNQLAWDCACIYIYK